MAFPTVESFNPGADSATGGAATTGGTAATSHNVVMPATVSAGAFLMVFGRVAVAGAVTASGWTVVSDTSDASDDVTFYAYQTALAAGTEDGTNVAFAHGSGKMAAVSVSITGADDPATRAPEGALAVTNGSNPCDPPSLSPTGGAKDYLWWAFFSWSGESTLSKSPPASYTDRADCSSGTGGVVDTNVQIKACDRQLNAASENPGSITASSAVTGMTGWTVAVHPPAAAAASLAWQPAPSSTYLR